MISFKLPYKYKSPAIADDIYYDGAFCWKDNNIYITYGLKLYESVLIRANTLELKSLTFEDGHLLFYCNRNGAFAGLIREESYKHKIIPNELSDPHLWKNHTRRQAVKYCNYLELNAENNNDVVILTKSDINYHQISKNLSTRILLLLPKVIRESNLKRSEVLIHNYNNNTTYQFNLKNPVVLTTFSPDGSLAAVMTTKELYFFDI